MLTDTDLVITELADDCARLERDVVAYRHLLQVALAELHDAQVALKKARHDVADKREEIRRYTSARV